MPSVFASPEQVARAKIDVQLAAAGWQVQDRSQVNLSAARGVAVREFPMAPGFGFADYLLYVDEQAVGALEAKKEGHSLTGVEPQAAKYSEGLPAGLPAPHKPLPFLYLGTGVETRFTNLLDPSARSRQVFSYHRPDTLAEWLAAEPLGKWLAHRAVATGAAEASPEQLVRPSTLRRRLRALPLIDTRGLWPNQSEALRNLERSLAEDRPRALIQMSTGSGKTLLAVAELYRLIKYGGIRRALFLVDRKNLGQQAEDEFAGFRTPDDNRKFTELYGVQRLTSNTVGSSAKVVITTIQRLYSMLKGEPDLPLDAEDASGFESVATPAEPMPVVYNAALPPEFFDLIVVDECHRSIYTVWRQVLEYFDAHIIGLTATPGKHTLGFFRGNLVMEYPHERAVADGVNVDFDVYRIRTQITEHGATIEKSDEPILGLRDRRTRAVRWEALDEDITYTADKLDRDVVAKDQIRLIVQTFRDKVLPERFPGRKHVPKTVIFAKNDAHAEDVVEIVREEFGGGNDFCQKITYKTTGSDPNDLIREFRNSFNPRVAVSVDMIATGTDIKPVEVVMFLRTVRSRVLFEQMKGRGVRVIDRDALRAVTDDATAKTHFLIVDCVGATEAELVDTQPLERRRSLSFSHLLEHVAFGGTNEDMLSSLASRLARLDRQCGSEDRIQIETASGGPSLHDVSRAIVDALDPDRQIERARGLFSLEPDATPSEAQQRKAYEAMAKEAVKPLAERPTLRRLLCELKQKYEQILDEVSQDKLLEAGSSEEAREKARALTRSFEEFLATHKGEIEALQFFYSQPYARRLRFGDVKALAEAIQAPPRAWTPERLWRAYEVLDKDRVRGAPMQRLLTDVVSLVRFALHQEGELVPYPERVHARFAGWMTQQANRGRTFTAEQSRWLEMMRDHIAASLEMDTNDFDLTPFVEEGGLGRAAEVFGPELPKLLAELNEALVA